MARELCSSNPEYSFHSWAELHGEVLNDTPAVKQGFKVLQRFPLTPSPLAGDDADPVTWKTNIRVRKTSGGAPARRNHGQGHGGPKNLGVFQQPTYTGENLYQGVASAEWRRHRFCHGRRHSAEEHGGIVAGGDSRRADSVTILMRLSARLAISSEYKEKKSFSTLINKINATKKV